MLIHHGKKKIIHHSWKFKIIKNMLFSVKFHLNTGFANLILNTSTRSNIGVFLWKSITIFSPLCQARKTSLQTASCIKTITDSKSLATKEIFYADCCLKAHPIFFLGSYLDNFLKQNAYSIIFKHQLKNHLKRLV